MNASNSNPIRTAAELVRLTRLAACLAPLFGAGAAFGQYIADGDLDGLAPGAAPSCGEPAGAWQIPDSYAFCELLPGNFEITPTSVFQPGVSGNSFHMNCSDLSDPEFASNLFLEAIMPGPGQVVRVEHDIWVPAAAPAGGTVFVGADNGGGGAFVGTDRGPQVSWMDSGEIVYWYPDPKTGERSKSPLLLDYPRDAWQRVRFDIRLDTQTFDFSWARKGESLRVVATGLPFRSPATQTMIDRFSAACIVVDVFPQVVECYIDNLTVAVLSSCRPDCTGDGKLNINDFICMQAKWRTHDPYGDYDGNGTYTVNDFIRFQADFVRGCP